MPTKRQVFELLKRNELIDAVRRFEVPVVDRRVRDQMIDALSSARRVRLDDILTGLSVARLKELVRELGVEAKGRGKASFLGALVAKGRALGRAAVGRVAKKKRPGRPKKAAKKKAAGRPRKAKPGAGKPPKKRRLLEELKRDELLGLLDRFELNVSDRRVRELIIRLLARRVPIAAILEFLPLQRLKVLAARFGIEVSGRSKAAYVEHLAGEAAPAAQPAKKTRRKKKAPAKKPARKKKAAAAEKPAPAKKAAAKKPARKKKATAAKKPAVPKPKKAAKAPVRAAATPPAKPTVPPAKPAVPPSTPPKPPPSAPPKPPPSAPPKPPPSAPPKPPPAKPATPPAKPTVPPAKPAQTSSQSGEKESS